MTIDGHSHLYITKVMMIVPRKPINGDDDDDVDAFRVVLENKMVYRSNQSELLIARLMLIESN